MCKDMVFTLKSQTSITKSTKKNLFKRCLAFVVNMCYLCAGIDKESISQMDIVLVIFAFLLLFAGLPGAFVPVLPGPPLSYAGLLLLQWSRYGDFATSFLWFWAVITVIVTIADYFLPTLMTQKFGGSRRATTGSVLGLFAGMIFFPPFGLIIGSFLGALVGELIHNHTDSAKAFKVALGAFLAFIFGTGAKLIISSVMIFYAIKEFF
jgi:uncharacterized protein YqgC (DUF456 family)